MYSMEAISSKYSVAYWKVAQGIDVKISHHKRKFLFNYVRLQRLTRLSVVIILQHLQT